MSILTTEELDNSLTTLVKGYAAGHLPADVLEKAKKQIEKLVLKWIQVRNEKTGKVFMRKYWVSPEEATADHLLKKVKEGEQFVAHFDHQHDFFKGDTVKFKDKEGNLHRGVVKEFDMHHSAKGKGTSYYLKVVLRNGQEMTIKQEQATLVHSHGGHKQKINIHEGEVNSEAEKEPEQPEEKEVTPEPEPEEEPEEEPEPEKKPKKVAKTKEKALTLPEGKETYIKGLGGSTGAVLVEIDGQQFVKKTGNSVAHVKSEYEANLIYKALGVNVPDAYFKDNTLYLKYIEDADDLQTGLAFDNDGSMVNTIRKNFAVDALLANYDVVGMSMDNILVKDGVPYRIDLGGALEYRAQGEVKKDYLTQKTHRTLLDPKINPNAAVIFNGISDHEIAEQLKNLDLSKLPEGVSKKTKDKLQKRLDMMLTDLEGAAGIKLDKHGFLEGSYYDTSGVNDKDIKEFYKKVDAFMHVSDEDIAYLKEHTGSYDGVSTWLTDEDKAKNALYGSYSVNSEHVKSLVNAGLNHREIWAMRYYTGQEYRDINKALASSTNASLGNISFENFQTDMNVIVEAEKNKPAAIADNFGGMLVKAAKTVNEHHVDKAYNMSTIYEMQGQLSNLKKIKKDIASQPETYTHKEQAMVDYYIEKFEHVNDAFAKQEKSKMVSHFDGSAYSNEPLVKPKVAEPEKVAEGNSISDKVKFKNTLTDLNYHQDKVHVILAKMVASGIRKAEIAGMGHTKSVYRGFDLYSSEYSTFKQQHAIGSTVSWQRITSTGATSGKAWPGNVKIKIDNVKGLDIHKFSQHTSEMEVLVKPFSSFKVKKMEWMKFNGSSYETFVLNQIV